MILKLELEASNNANHKATGITIVKTE